MASKRITVRHVVGGGLVTDVGNSADVGPAQNGDLILPFLTTANNVFYEPDGGPHKIPGTAKLNSSALASGAEIMGIYDYWTIGASGAGTQKRIVHVSTVIMADAADGSFSNIQTGMTDNAVPCYCQFEGSVIMSSTAGDTIQTYNGTTCTALGGTPPVFSFAVSHKNRVWAAGVSGNQSRLYYCSQLNAADWTTTGGYIDIAPNDGDRITGLVSQNNQLYVFKGPNFGSIHVIGGSSPTGSDAFSRSTAVEGIGAVWHNTIFKYRNDVGFMWSDGSIHSLGTALSYSRYADASLSRPIKSYLDSNLALAQLQKVWAVADESKSMVLITVPLTGSTFCNQILMMDYSRDRPWWSLWPAFNANCAALVKDTTDSRRRIFIGGQDGFVRKTDQSARSIDGSGAYTSSVKTPFLNYGNALQVKTLGNASVNIAPKGSYSSTFGWQRDANTQQTGNIVQGTSGASVPLIDRFINMEEGGEFKSIQYELKDATAAQDLEVHTFSAEIEMGPPSTETV